MVVEAEQRGMAGHWAAARQAAAMAAGVAAGYWVEERAECQADLVEAEAAGRCNTRCSRKEARSLRTRCT